MSEHSQLIKKMCIELPWPYTYTEEVFRLFIEVLDRLPKSSTELMATAPYLPLIKAEKAEKALKQAREYLDKV